MKRVSVIDYGMGNLRSVYNAFASLGCDTSIARNPADLENSEYIVLPGVGAFGDGMRNLQHSGWVDALKKQVKEKKKPFLGICLGMQLLATFGSEYGRHQGLDWVKGAVNRIQPSDAHLRIPHIGWNDVYFKKKDGLYRNLPEPACFYFVHSYAFFPQDDGAVSGTFSYGNDFAASIESENICAVQFHPEKSQKAGIAVLKNFLEHSKR